MVPPYADPNACVIRAFARLPLTVDGHDHGVVAIHTDGRRFDNCTPSSALQQLSSDLGADGRVASCKQEIQQCLSLILGDIIPVSLRKGEQALVPDDW